MKKAFVLVLLCMLTFTDQAFAQVGNQFSFSLVPSYLMPLETGFRYFTPGAGVGLAIEYQFPVVGWLGVRFGVDGSYLPIWTGDGCALFSIGGGPTLTLPTLGGLTNMLFGSAGYYYGVIADSQNRNGGNFFLSGGLRTGWQIAPSVNLGAEGVYRFASDGMGGALYHGLSFGVSARYSLLQASPVRLREIQLYDVFPVFQKYYDTHSMGKVVIENSGTASVKDLEVTFFVDKYMDNPTQCPAPAVLKGGQKVTIDLFALFSEKVLTITEATIVSGKVAVTYTQENKHRTAERSASLNVYDRNAITWDDDRKVAAFVLYKDPAVLEIAKTLAHVVKDSVSVDANLCTAMALHEALRQFGMSYVVDPTSSYALQSKSKLTVDYIQYPRNTLQYKSGDCDDLSVLYAAILQGVGIDTAFITIPGHIYMAFALKMSPEQARKLMPDPSVLIINGGKAWVPVEVTQTNKDFMEAWSTGASEWKENEAAAAFTPVAQAWEVFSPVGYFEDTRAVSFVPEASILSVYQKELSAFTDRQLAGLKQKIEKAAEGSANKAPSLNSLAILCAQYGRRDTAKEYLGQALRKGDYFPALVNLGNILFLEGDDAGALAYYLRAAKLKADDVLVTLHLSQVYARLGNGREADANYKKLAALDPALASRHSDLGSSQAGQARAAGQVSESEAMIWQE
jgi:tetratricopeptide (TPR) repeat protein